MITINTSPLQGRVLLDANNTIISVTSTNGAGYYFRALIYVDGSLHDTQGWSRKDFFTAEKDLKKLYNAYFTPQFNPDFTNSLVEQTHLKKLIAITVKEYTLEDGTETASIDLPSFYFMYNAKPVEFSDLPKVQILGIEPDVLLVPANGKIAIPFMVKSLSEDITVTVKNNFNSTLNSQTITNIVGNKIYLYHFDLGTISPLMNNTIYFIATITCGIQSINKIIRLLDLPDYPVKELTLLNNFGYWQYAYLDGQLSIDNNLDVNTYEQLDNSEKVFEINETETYTINTGSFLGSEQQIIHQVVNALESKLYFNSEWLSLVNANKKIQTYQDRANNYSENLNFSLRKNASVSNVGMSHTESPAIFLDSAILTGTTLECVFHFSEGYSPVAVIPVVEKDGIMVAGGLADPVSPQLVDVSEVSLPFNVRIEFDVISNQITVTS